MSDAYVRSVLQNGIRSVEFFHPQSNSLPAQILSELADAITAAGNDPDTRVIVLRSIGDKAFCAGASFDELVAIDDEAGGLKFFSGFAHVINAMRKTPQPIIARIQSKCVGGGVGLAAAADYAIAIDNASIKLSELAVGIGPFVVGPVVERKMGIAAYTQLAFDAQSWRSVTKRSVPGLPSTSWSPSTTKQADSNSSVASHTSSTPCVKPRNPSSPASKANAWAVESDSLPLPTMPLQLITRRSNSASWP